MSSLLESLKTHSSRVLDQIKGNIVTGNGDDEENLNAVELKSNGLKTSKSERFVNESEDPNNNGEEDSQQVLMQQQQGNDSWWAEELATYCPKLTFQERLIGFATTFGLGYLIAFFSFRFFIKLMEGNPLPFAINYTSGHVLQLLSSMFLCGPQRQFRNMFDPTRYLTSVIYLSCLAITLVLVFIPLKPHILKLLILVALTMAQFCASCWYSLSYIPYGRRTALRLIYKTLGLTPPASSNTTAATVANIFGRSPSQNFATAPAPERENSFVNIFGKGLS